LTVLCLLFCKYVYHCSKPAWKKISWCCAISRGLELEGGEIKSVRVPLLCSWIILSICLSCKNHCYCRHSWNCCAAYVEICSNLMRVMRICPGMLTETKLSKLRAASSSPHQCCNELAEICRTFVLTGISSLPSPHHPTL
jgi:hypothetical protein